MNVICLSINLLLWWIFRHLPEKSLRNAKDEESSPLLLFPSFIPLLDWGVCSAHFTHRPLVWFHFSNCACRNFVAAASSYVPQKCIGSFHKIDQSQTKSPIFEVQWEYPWSLDTDWRRTLVEGLHAAASRRNTVITFNLMGIAAVLMPSRCAFSLVGCKL